MYAKCCVRSSLSCSVHLSWDIKSSVCDSHFEWEMTVIECYSESSSYRPIIELSSTYYLFEGYVHVNQTFLFIDKVLSYIKTSFPSLHSVKRFVDKVESIASRRAEGYIAMLLQC